MATTITEKPIASAIVTAQIEIHMVDPHGGSPLNALMGIGFRLGRKNALFAKGQKRTFQSPAAATTARTLRISGSLKIKRPSPFMGA